MATVTYDAATCRYRGADVPAVDELNLDIADGEFMVLVGPSGSGKSTALRMLAGLEPVSSGAVLVDGEDVSHRSPRERDIAMVFQNYALYPHMTVAENMSFGLRLQGVDKALRLRKVLDAARLLGLEDLLERLPAALSGGQRQRVAMGRAIVRHPAAFLMDEPLSNLDAKLRVETRANISELQERLGTTTVYVTHDQVEAMTMGHRVAVLRDGKLQQVDTPQRLYEQPANTFVAEFIGSPSMNLVRVRAHDGAVTLDGCRMELKPSALDAVGRARVDELTVGLRPEAFRVVDDVDSVTLRVRLVEALGADSYVHGTIGDSGQSLVVRVGGNSALRHGDVIRVRPDATAIHLFHPVTGNRLKIAA